jgi:2'-5' RNA ligase
MHDESMASDAEEFWERRHALVPSPAGASPAAGDRRLVLLADVSDPDVVSHYESVRSRLAAFACLRPMPPDSLHVTVKLLDREFVRSADGASSASPRRRDAGATVSAVVAEFEPFELSFPRFNLFPDVVYAEVEDGGRLGELNRALCRLPATRTLARDCENYIPHLTLGYLAGREEYHDLVGFLERNRELSFPTLLVDRLHLVSYGSVDGRPTYRTLRTYDLRT